MSLLLDIEKLKKQNLKILQRQVDLLVQLLEDKVVGVGSVTFEGLEKAIRKVFAEYTEFRDHSENNETLKSHVVDESSKFKSFMRKGSLHLAPEDFEFPACTPLPLWQLWCCGDSANDIILYGRLKPSDIVNKLERKRLSNIRFLMGTEVEKLPTSIKEANALFHSFFFASNQRKQSRDKINFAGLQ